MVSAKLHTRLERHYSCKNYILEKKVKRHMDREQIKIHINFFEKALEHEKLYCLEETINFNQVS